MCQEVAVIPFLWILPLTLYLLSFIICFYSERGYKRLFYLLALIAAVAASLAIIPRSESMTTRLQIVGLLRRRSSSAAWSATASWRR